MLLLEVATPKGRRPRRAPPGRNARHEDDTTRASLRSFGRGNARVARAASRVIVLGVRHLRDRGGYRGLRAKDAGRCPSVPSRRRASRRAPSRSLATDTTCPPRDSSPRIAEGADRGCPASSPVQVVAASRRRRRRRPPRPRGAWRRSSRPPGAFPASHRPSPSSSPPFWTRTASASAGPPPSSSSSPCCTAVRSPSFSIPSPQPRGATPRACTPSSDPSSPRSSSSPSSSSAMPPTTRADASRTRTRAESRVGASSSGASFGAPRTASGDTTLPSRPNRSSSPSPSDPSSPSAREP